MAPLRCEKVRERLSAYIDGELGPKEKAALESHLAACPSCSAEVEELRSTAALVHSLPRAVLPPSFHATLMSKVKEDALAAARTAAGRQAAAGVRIGGGSQRGGFFDAFFRWRYRWVVATACLAVFVLWAGSFAYFLGLVPTNFFSLHRAGRQADVASTQGVGDEGAATFGKMAAPNTSLGAAATGAAPPEATPPGAGESFAAPDSMAGAGAQGLGGGLAAGATGSAGATGFGVTVNALSVEPASGRKVILMVSMTLQCDRLPEARDRAVSAVEAAGGFVEAMNYWTDATGTDSAALTLRVPSEKLSNVLVNLRNLGKVTQEQASRVDVTAQHIDTTVRIENLREQEQSLLALLGKAESLADVFAIQSELTRVRTEIEMYEATLRSLDEQISYSTINLTLTPGTTIAPSPVASVWERIARAFVNSLKWMAVAFEKILIFLAGLLPVAVVIGLIVLGVVAAVRSRRRRLGV